MYKKIRLAALAIIVIGFAGALGIYSANAEAPSLYNCYRDLGLTWTSVQARAESGIPAQFGIWKYSGTAAQNTLLAGRMCGAESIGEPVLGAGFSVATGYRSTLSLPMTASQTTVPVSALTTKDGHTLTMSDLGSYVFLTLEPGSTKEEIVMCTGIAGSTFTGCTRGLAFYGTSTTAVAANQKTHNAGSTIVMSNVHYVYEQFVDTNAKDQTVAGNKTYTGTNLFYSFPVVSSTGYTGLPTQNGQLATKYYVDTVGAGGFTADNILPDGGLAVAGTSPEKAYVYVRADKGMVTSTDGVYQSVDTSTGLTQGASGIGLSTSTLVGLIATTTPSANVLPLSDASSTIRGWGGFGGTGLDGDLTISSGTTTLNCGSADVLEKNYNNVYITGTGILTASTTNNNGCILLLKVKGNLIVTSTATASINLDGWGAKGKTGAGYAGAGLIRQTNPGSGYTGGIGLLHSTSTLNKIINIYTGAAGSGQAVNGTGTGANGGGALYMEVGGNVIMSGTSTFRGLTGTIVNANNNNCSGGGGAGGGSRTSATDGEHASKLVSNVGNGSGGGGVFYLTYGGSISNTMTILTNGGSLVSTDCYGGAGGDGYSMVVKNMSWW